MTPVVIAVDAGTGSARALAFDADGGLVASASREWSHRAVPGHPGGTSFDTTRGWEAIVAALREVVAALAGRTVAAIAASSMREGFVLYDAGGRELWACPNTDGRARREADDLVREGVADEIYRVSGDWISITAPARLRWIARHEPETLDRSRHLGMLSDWVTTRLTGVFATEPTCGSSSALFDLHRRTWSVDLAQAVGIDPAILPPVVECGTPVGVVTDEVARATGLVSGTPVIAGGADTQLALHGIAARPGAPTIIGGTFWQTTAVVDTPVVDPLRRLRTLCHVDPSQWMVEGIGFLSGLAMRWFRDEFCPDAAAEAAVTGRTAFAVMEDWATAAPAGAGGVVAVLANVMQTDAWHHAAPSFVGFDIHGGAGGTRGAFVRAIEESAAVVAAAHLRMIAEITGGSAVSQGVLTFTGGSSAGALWPRIVAACTGLETRVTRAPEATAYGAARLAAQGVGIDLAPMGAPDVAIRPADDDVADYREISARWHRVYRDAMAMSAGDLPPLFTPPGAARPAGDLPSPTAHPVV